MQTASRILGLVLLTGVNIIRRDCFDSRLLSHEKTWHNTAHTPTKGRPDLQIEACLHDTVEMHVPESPERIFAGANQAATFTWKTNLVQGTMLQSLARISQFAELSPQPQQF